MSSVATGHQRIFISYRREEASGHAGRIYDAMVARFGEDNVFMDVDIAPGVDFVDHITNVVSSCTVLIAVMGKSWAEAPGPDGHPRLQDEADFVRLEVGTAVQNSDVTVIPALVDKARMPRAEQLPEEMRPLARRNALELSDGRWRYDVGRLNDTLEQLLAGLTGFPAQVHPEPPTPTPTPEAPTPTPTPGPPTPATATPLPVEPASPPRAYSLPEAARLMLEGLVVAAVAVFLARLLGELVPAAGEHLTDAEKHESQAQRVILRRTICWAMTGGALALWLAIRTRRADLARCALLGLVVGGVAGSVGGAIYAIPAKLPEKDVSDVVGARWAVASLAVTGALIGGLLGTLWRRPRLAAGLAAGLVGGALIQLLFNIQHWNPEAMPGVGYNFAVAAIAITAVSLAVLLALDFSRSSSSARAPAAR
jgi:hypothetical protein